jgi:hypothetical protein
MPSDPADRYEAWYAHKLWNLLPAIYRAEDLEPDVVDETATGPLRELVERIGAQVAIVRRSIDRLWEDQSIETCDDWVIDYIGDLLATNQVSSLDARGRRLDVAKTIYYRRRKGTVALLEELATGITGWGVRVGEMFHRLGRTRHGLDPAIGRPALPGFSAVTYRGTGTGTLVPGGTPVDDHAVTVRIDVGGAVGTAQWSTKLDDGAWVPRNAAVSATIDTQDGGALTVALVDGAAAPSFVAGDELAFAVQVDPIVRFQRAQRLVGARTRTPAGGMADLRDVQGAALAGTAFDEYAHTADVRRGRGKTGWYDIPHLGVFAWRLRSLPVELVTPVKVDGCPHLTFDPTGRDAPLFAAGDRPSGDAWISPEPHQLPVPLTRDLVRGRLVELYRPFPERADERRSLAIYRVGGANPLLVPVNEVAPDGRNPMGRMWIDPERGRVVFPPAPAPAPIAGDHLVDYHAGFSSEIGAGCYDRPPPPPASDEPPLSPSPAITDPTTALAVAGVQSIVIGNSLTYDTVGTGGPIERAVIAAGDQRRPLVRLARIPPAVPSEWTLTGATGARDGRLTLDGLFVSGGALVLAGAFETVVVSACTFDPGTWRLADGTTPAGWARAADTARLTSTPLRIEGTVGRLVVDRSITGPIATAGAGRVGLLEIRESIVQAADPSAFALAIAGGEVVLSRSTILGRAQVHRVDASECILHEQFVVEDTQHGCVRFTAYADTSAVPRPYESVAIGPAAPLFTSRRFGDPGYAQLRATASAEISEGAENGSEMGAFWREANAIKERSLLIKFEEYLPLGLEPVVVCVT